MKRALLLVWASLLRLLPRANAATASNPWDPFISSPAARHVQPVAVHASSGHVTITTAEHGHPHLSMAPGDQVSFDFGVEVGGWISLNANASAGTPQFSLAFAESPSFVRSISDDTGAVPTQDYDKALNVSLPRGPNFYVLPRERFRGGFRFLTICAFEPVTISNVTCEIGFAPGVGNLRDYSGHFYTPDDNFLVRTWYAGAYTVQTNIAPQDTGRFLPQVKPGWAYNASLGVAAPILVDGAKRDRAVWPGDLGIQGTTAFLAFGADGLVAFGNSLDTSFYYQNKTTGRFPFAGPDTASFRSGSQSDTYHAWTLIAMYNYAIYTGDSAWLALHWSNITRGIDFILAALDNSHGLHNQTAPNDWGRQGGGGYNSALNALDYHALVSFAGLPSTWTSNTILLSQGAQWAAAAGRLKSSYNALLWSSQDSLYRDNQSTILTPQDGNALALLYNLTNSPGQASSLSAALTRFWSPIGPITPELPDTISPFVTGLEVLAHFSAAQPSRAIELMRLTWSHLLDSPLMTGSTLAEGITANGSLYYRGNAGYNHDAAYTSLSHGWSSGPTQALSFRVAGLEIVGWRKWRFRPFPGSLKTVQSGFDSPLGAFEVAWTVSGNANGSFNFEATLTTPIGTTGLVQLPWVCEGVFMNGELVKETVTQRGGRQKLTAVSCLYF
ncbi:glycoside hydrolase family 78 protein [Trematosphaeria pertusa]|uniref:Glycoside hydrolase family 78 protein n=1 Tax=Trematosphaeria pertusa TaxID=390896 RepID=A0A6A6IMU2_9PLEO|nr:glycoside hydrolase family 78 protein [Trematosphaeria pertusa]KAF2251771.1 glycoside hydrolase family 78 protein [Trematosphaeria pertusa]